MAARGRYERGEPAPRQTLSGRATNALAQRSS